MSLGIQCFQVDITPPIGTYLCKGYNGQCTGIETPIHLRGSIFSSNNQRYVVVAMDFTMLCGQSHRDICQGIADAAQIPVEQVVVQTVHQHDVPGMDPEIHAVLHPYIPDVHDDTYWQSVLDKTAVAVEQAVQEKPRQVSAIKTASAAVHEYASNRRLHKGDEFKWRGSKCQNVEIKELPTGNIDPLLRQTAFYDENDALILSMSTYASHPQVADRRALISDDAPGFALRRLSKKYPDAMHMYFTGCGANIANGKFASPDSTADIETFGNKLADAMEVCLENGEEKNDLDINWQAETRSFPLRSDTESVEVIEQQLKDDEQRLVARYRLAKRLFIKQQQMNEYPFSVSKMSIGNVHWYFLPAEMFVEYQQHLTEKHPDETVMVAAYGDAFIAYVPTAKDFAVGGYEVGSCWLDENCEEHIHKLFDEF